LDQSQGVSLPVEQLRALASYYREIIASLSYQSGRHLIDLGTGTRYGLTADLGLYFPHPSILLEQEAFSFRVERVSPEAVTEVVELASRAEEAAEGSPNEALADDQAVAADKDAKSALTARLIAIYRKQQQDPFNRETILGYPVVAGRYGSVKFCAPLLYFPVDVQYDPMKGIFSIAKKFEVPTLNSHLIVKLTGSEDEATAVRREILPLLYQAEFGQDTLEKLIRVLAELAPGLRGMKREPTEPSSLAVDLDSRNNLGSTLFQTAVLVNAKRTGAFLQDDLTELEKLEELTEETVVSTLLADIAEDIEEPTDPDLAEPQNPLLFPLQSNRAQRFAARKAERSKLLVIQGPPGTGKSQTITNLICHLTARGHSVLVTSHQNKALEVITQMLPKIDYLAMSLLKGEKESVSQLANQLERFSATVEGKTLNALAEARDRSLSKLAENEGHIRRLTARFSELKILERDRTKPYQKYHSIREYDHIDRRDTLHDGDSQTVSKSLARWWSILCKAQPYLSDLVNVFGDYGTPPETIVSRSKSIVDLIAVFRDTQQLIETKEDLLGFIRGFVKEDGLSEDDRKYLLDWSAWLRKHKNNILTNQASLQSNSTEQMPLAQVLQLARCLGLTTNQNILQEAERNAENTRRLLEIGPPPNGLPDRPDDVRLTSVQEALNDLLVRSDSWYSWFLVPSAYRNRRKLRTLGMGNVGYSSRQSSLQRLKKWAHVWALRKTVIASLHRLQGAGVPVGEPDQQTTPAQLAQKGHAALAFAQLLTSLGAAPHGPSSRVHRELIEQKVCALETDAQATALIESLVETDKQLTRLDRLARLMDDPQFERISELPKRYLLKTIKSVDISDHIRNEVSRWDSLVRFADSYAAASDLESTALSSLRLTVNALRGDLANGKKAVWMDRPDIAVEAFHLSAFIREDLLKNPDDIQEIARALEKAHTLRQSLVEDVIRRTRLVSLKRAEQDNATRFQIVKLRQLLRKKKKTPSLVQLRDQIEYRRLLKVFPCWIMSIEDVARIFPLEAGLFDYLIVDEASQCNQATTLHLAYRAKRLAVVGDRQQLKNANVRFLSDNLVRMLLSKYGLDKHPRADFLHGRESLLALAEAGANTTSFLNEHFRCEPPIITWSNDNFYASRLRILTPIRPRRFVPVAEVRLVDSADDDTEYKVNRVEAQAVIAEVKRLINNGSAKGLDIGIISPYEAQATLLNNLLHETFSENPELLQEHRLTASTADGFQGDERDIILYSFRFGASSSPGVIRAIELERERLNVAFSRARRKVISFISRPPSVFPSGLIRSFIEHSMEIQKQAQSRLSTEITDKFDSEFERRVCEALRNRGLTVLTQVPCAGFFIDLVVLDSDCRRLAVECDGEFHYDEDNELRPEDYQRQDIIVRSGWAVYRVSTRRFYANPGASIESVIQELKAQPTELDLFGRDVSVVDDREVVPVQSEDSDAVLGSEAPAESPRMAKDDSFSKPSAQTDAITFEEPVKEHETELITVEPSPHDARAIPPPAPGASTPPPPVLPILTDERRAEISRLARESVTQAHEQIANAGTAKPGDSAKDAPQGSLFTGNVIEAQVGFTSERSDKVSEWDRLATQMIREMIRQFLRQPGEFLTFGQLAFRIPNSDKDILHSVAENRSDLFVLAKDDRSTKLHLEAVQRILQDGIEAVTAPPMVPHAADSPEERIRCGHFSQEELLADLQRFSLPGEALTRKCCWTEICRLRAFSRPQIDAESWREICVTRGYLLERQNPRGF
jgi:very-short-patch-repair endonuclease